MRINLKNVISILILLAIVTIQINILFVPNYLSENQDTGESPLIPFEYENKEIMNPLSSDYNKNLTASTNNVKVTLHQAYNSTAVQSFDEVSNTFNVAAPNATNFNVSSSNIVINNIKLNNYTKIIEDVNVDYKTVGNLAYLTSFSIPISCMISNFSFYIREYAGVTGDVNIVLSPANSTDPTKPKLDYNKLIVLDQLTITASKIGWVVKSNINYFLNNSLTTSNTWFIGVNLTSGSSINLRWYFNPDTSPSEDKTLSYEWAGGKWSLLKDGTYDLDLTSKIGLGFSNPNHTPSQFNLQINNLTVYNNLNHPDSNSGFWNHTGFGSDGSNSISYVFSGDWYDYSLQVNQTEINYTKTFYTNTSYTVESGVNAYWTSQANFTAFDHRLNNNTINFTIPLSWTVTSLKRNTTTISYSTYTNSSNKIITVFGSDAIDGNWTLKSQSSNLISSVKVGRSGKEITLAYSNETITFNATFSKSISGTVNLSVYNPSDLGNELNYTKEVSINDATSVDFGSWIISQNITNYGEFRVQVYWENSTDLGIHDTTIFIAGATEYSLLTTNNTEYLNSGSPFNISLYYTDVMKGINVTGATLEYNLNLGNGWQNDATQSNADKTYNITVDPTQYSVGYHEIPIHLNKSKYMNYSISYGFYVVNNTQLYEYTQANSLTAIRGQNTTYIFNFNQTWQDTPIAGATISVNSLQTGLVWSYSDDGSGNYTIRINSSQVNVDTYTCDFKISKTDYRTQNFQFDITVVQAQTSIEFINQTNNIKRISDLNFTTYVRVKDTDNNWNVGGITPGSLTVLNITGTETIWNTDEASDWRLWEVGDGIYGVNISLGSTGVNRIDFGNYSIRLNISYSPNYNWSTLDLSFHVLGNSTSIILLEVNDGSENYYNGSALAESPVNTYHILQNPTGSVEFALHFDYIDTDNSNSEINFAGVRYWALLNSSTSLETTTFVYLQSQYHHGHLTLPESLAVGTYEIEIITGLKNYENASYTFYLIIEPISTKAVLDSIIQIGNDNHTNPEYNAGNNTYFVYAQYDLQLDFLFQDLNNSVNIQSASYAKLNYNGNNLTITETDGDVYRWNIQSSSLIVGSHIITVYFGKTDYENASYSFNLTILLLPTDAGRNLALYQPSHNDSMLSGNPFIVYRPFNLWVNSSYFDTNNSVYLAASYKILNYNGKNYTSNYYRGNLHGWEVPVEDLVIGVQTITIYFGLDNYKNASYSFDIDCRFNPTNVSFIEITQPDHQPGIMLPYNSTYQNYTAYSAYSITLNMSTYDTINNTFLSSAIVQLSFNSQIYNPNFTSNDMFIWVLPVIDLDLGTFNVTITFSKTYYFNNTYSFNISIYDLPTDVAVNSQFSISQPDHNSTVLSNEPFLVYTAYSLVINCSYWDTYNSEPISLANAWLYLDGTFISTSNSYNTTAYGWILDISGLSLGDHEIWLNFSKDHYRNSSKSFIISVDHQVTTAELVDITQEEHSSATLIKGAEPLNNYTVYMKYGLNLSLSFTDPTNGSTPIETATVTFWLDGVSFPVVYSGSHFLVNINANDLQAHPGDFIPVLIHFNETFHYNQTIAFNLTIVVLPTTSGSTFEITQPQHNNSQLSGTPFVVYIPFNLYLNCSYWDTFNNESVNGAWAIIEYNGINYSYSDYSSSLYRFNIDSSLLIEGENQIITFYFGLDNYANSSYTITISVKILPTSQSLVSLRQPNHVGYEDDELIADPTFGSYSLYRAYDFRLEFSLVDPTNSNSPISTASVSFLYNGVPYNLSYSSGSGTYFYVIPAENLTVGNEIISVHFTGVGLQAQTILLNISVFNLPTEFRNFEISQPSSGRPVELSSNSSIGFVIYDSFDLTLNGSFYDTNNSKYLANAWNQVIFNNSIYTKNYFASDKYGWLIPAVDLIPGVYVIEIKFGLDTYENVSKTFNITIEILATSIHFNENTNDNDLRQEDRPNYLLHPVEFIGGVYHVFVKYDVIIDVVYYNEIDNSSLISADYAFLSYRNFNTTGVEFEPGSYRFTIPASVLSLGLYNATLNFGKLTYENATRVIYIQGHLLSTQLLVNSLEQSEHQGVISQNLINSSSHVIYLPFDTSLTVEFIDLNNTLPISSATVAELTFNGSLVVLDSQANGVYSWFIPKSLLSIGSITVQISLQLEDYQSQVFICFLNVSIVNIQGELINLQQDDEELTFNETSQQYSAFAPFDILLSYRFIDSVINSTFNNVSMVDLTLNGDHHYNALIISGNFVFTISSSDLLLGTNEIIIHFFKYGYENITVSININVISEYSVSITLLSKPTSVTQGDKLSLVFQVSYSIGDEIFPLEGESVTLRVDHPDISPITNITDENGKVYFEFVLPIGDYSDLNISVEYNGQQYGIAESKNSIEITVEAPPGIPIWVVYIILGFVGFIAIAVTVQKKVIQPRRMHFTDLVMSSATIFEDAINIQHIMVIYKSWGTSIFFKSFAEDTFDPDLISGFLSAVQSFGKELKSQNTLNELSYGDKILLFSDGEFIRVTLVLSKTASPFLKRNLSKFVNVFEVQFKDQLVKWHGQLNVFQGAEDLVDEVLKTSVILPHRFNPEIKKPKDLQRALTKQVLSIAQSLIGENRPFLFLAQLLQQALDETGKDAPEIILSITELLDNKILIPIKIEQIERPELTESQKQELHARVWEIPNKTNLEKEEIFEQLIQLSEAEREVALSSLLQKVTITSEYTKEEYEIPKFTDEKAARKEIKSLISQAKKAAKSQLFDEALKFYEIAEIIAIQWNFKETVKELESVTLSTTVLKENTIMKTSKKRAKKHEKSKEYELAHSEYQNALDAAHRLFQLGFQEYEEEIKSLTHKVVELKHECKSEQNNEECLDESIMINSRKKLIKFYNKNEPKLTYREKIVTLTRIAVISNLLFKSGNASEIKNIRTYQKKIESVKKSLAKESESVQKEIQENNTVLQEMAENLEKLIKEAELNENWLESLLLYQKRVDISYQLGNIDRGVYFIGQIKAKLEKVPYLFDLIDDYSQKLSIAEEQNNPGDKQKYHDLLKLLHEIMFEFDL
ncbi:MAG: hypothetical protein K9W44_06485 [Candidatus Lokiarchaeota archaeon]|nr:hypothetical protein [Candidatus Harpocratesius repetitus]